MHRNDATGGAYVRSFAEAIQTYVDTNGYKTCATAASGLRRRRGARPAAGYTKSVTAVQSWNGSAWGACTADGIQRLDLKVTTTGDAEHTGRRDADGRPAPAVQRRATTAGADPCS